MMRSPNVAHDACWTLRRDVSHLCVTQAQELLVQVYDKDDGDTDDFLGEATVLLREFARAQLRFGARRFRYSALFR
jgi:hypothetical protein